jgi:4'-phosphopantetheinyl transferase
MVASTGRTVNVISWLPDGYHSINIQSFVFGKIFLVKSPDCKSLFCKKRIKVCRFKLPRLAGEQAVYLGKRNPLGRLRFLAGRLLARQLFRTLCPGEICPLIIGSAGKPFLGSRPQWGVSIAHSGAIVACALNTRGHVGIDAEAIRPVDFAVFEAYFLSQEWEYVRQHSDPAYAFMELWTRKEAVAKADGRGMGMDFLSIDTLKDTIQTEGVRWGRRTIDFGGGYAAAVAYSPNGPPAEMQLQQIEMNELFDSF